MAAQDRDFICMLRATSRAHALGGLLSRFPRWKPDSWWQAGAPDHHGRVHTHSGFNLLVADGRDWKLVRAAMMRRLRSLEPMIALGREQGARFVLDAGVTPGRREYWYLEARFTPEDQALLARLGVELCVTAFPIAPPPRPAARKNGHARARGARDGARAS